MLGFALSALRRLTILNTPLVSSNFWPLYCLPSDDLRFSIPLWYLQTFGICIVCLPTIYGFQYPFGIFKLLAFVLSALRRFTVLNTPLVSSNFLSFVLSALRRFTVLNTHLVSSNFWSLYCLPSDDLRFSIPLWYLQTFGLCIVCPPTTYGSQYPFGIFKRLAFVLPALRRFTVLNTPLVSSNFWPLYFLPSDDLRFSIPRWYLQTFVLCIVCAPTIYGSQYPFGIFKLLVFVLSALRRFTVLNTPLVSSNFWPLHCLPSDDLRFSIPLWYLQTFGLCIACPPTIYGSQYPFGIFKLLAFALPALRRFTFLNTPLLSSNFSIIE